MAEPTPPGDKPAPKPEAAKPAAAAEKPAAAAEKPAVAAKPTPAAKPAPAKAGAKPAVGAKGAPAAPVAIAAPTMKAEIRARVRKGRPGRFDVKADGSVLGRDDAAGVPILLDGVSREHARIKWDGKGWWLEDLKSTNGTFVNGEKVLRERLQHLDVISLGRKADVVFMLRAMDAEMPATRPGVVRAALVEADDGTVYEIPVGEFTLGRSSACNVVANENAVSKVHARIERAADQVVLEDLSSSNGTFVNGTRVRTAVLRDTDTLELANVAKFKVVIELGEVGATGLYRAPTFAKKEEQPKFSGEWKTRYEWDPAELAAIAAAAAGQRPPELDQKGQAEPPAGPKHVVQGEAKKAPPAAAPALAPKPVAAAPKVAPAPAPAAAKPATPASEKVVPRPVKTEAPADDRPKGTPPPARPSTPAGTDPASTPSAPALDPRPAAAPPSPIVPAVAPAAAPAAAPPKPAIPSPRTVAPPPPRPAPAAPPADFVAGSTVVDTPAPSIPSSPPPATPVKIVTARFAGEKFTFDVTTTRRFEVGRSASTAFRVDHTTVSRRHAALTLSEDRAHLVVEDLGAANGTRVNGREIKGTQELQDRDVLELGEVRFMVRFERA